MDHWRKLGKNIEELLRVQTYPLAVKFTQDETEFPEKTRRPDQKIAICQALTISRKWGWTMGIASSDSGCPGASLAYGWTQIADEETMAQFFFQAGYVSDEAAAQSLIANVDRLETDKYCGVVISPLTRTRIVPDVILEQDIDWAIDSSSGSVDIEISQYRQPTTQKTLDFVIDVSSGDVSINYDLGSEIGLRLTGSTSSGEVDFPGGSDSYQSPNYASARLQLNFNIAVSSGDADAGPSA
ncbi:MAG: DUF169 domain-containing protein [Candidatus Heimdallarchaeota archaeon]